MTLAGAHFLVDNYSSMLGAFLPFLHQKLNLSLSQAGILAGMLIFSSSLMQPLYGYLADRIQHRGFAALGPGLAGLFISMLGLAPDFFTLMLLVVLGGVGIASFHPQAAAVTSEQAGDHHGYQMSIFITGGMIGYALGPIYITTIISLAGLGYSYWAALPGLLMSAYMLVYGPSPRRTEVNSDHPRFRQQVTTKLRPLILLYFLVVIRSILQMVFVAFLPLYFTMQGYTEMQASRNLTLFLLSGGTAGFLGGLLADRFGGRTVIAWSMLASFPLLMGFLLTDGLVAILLAVAGGGALLFTTPVNIVMAQKLVPQAAGTISALMMGFAWGVGGGFVPMVGFLSDSFGLETTLIGLVFLTVPGFFVALALPALRKPDDFTQLVGVPLEPRL